MYSLVNGQALGEVCFCGICNLKKYMKYVLLVGAVFMVYPCVIMVFEVYFLEGRIRVMQMNLWQK